MKAPLEWQKLTGEGEGYLKNAHAGECVLAAPIFQYCKSIAPL